MLLSGTARIGNTLGTIKNQSAYQHAACCWAASTVRFGTDQFARRWCGQPIDPGYAKLRRLIDDARTAGVDRVNHATYQTVLGTADECITKVAGIDTVGPQAVRPEYTSLLTQMIADLEARLTETTG